MVNLTQKLLRALFRTLDFVEDVRVTLRRVRGKDAPPAPWQSAAPPPPPPAPPPTPTASRRAANDDDAAPARSRPPPPRSAKPARARKPAPRARTRPPAAAGASEEGASIAPLLDAIANGGVPALSPDLNVDGKTMPARVIWALAVGRTVLGRGLTGPEMSQALERGGMVTAPNNIMRTIRQDGGRFFQRSPGEGRAVIMTLTDEGEAQARTLGVLTG